VRKLRYITAIIFILIKCKAQNLVNNPSFEDAINDTSIILDSGNNFTCDFWNTPSKGSPDYFTKKRDVWYGVPSNIFGCQEPHTGFAYAGIAVYSDPRIYEYMQVKLKQKLVKDQNYCLSLFISPPNKEYFTSNEIDFALSNIQIHQNHEIRMKNIPFDRIISKNGDFKINGWNQISFNYHAKGGEEFLILGLFNSDYKLSLSRNIKFEGFKCLYFYIDDVSLTPIKDSNECKCNTITFQKNAFNDCLIEDSKSLTIDNLVFKSNEATINDSSKIELLELAKYLKSYPTYTIEIIGHTDSVGSENNNQLLSEKRAKNVADFLIANGVSTGNLLWKGIGNSKPIKTNNTEGNRLKNRCVEIIIKKKKFKKASITKLPNTDSTTYFFKERKHLEAVKYLTKKIATNKHSSNIVYDYYNLACVYSITKNFPKCLESIKKVVAIDSSFYSFIEDPDFYNIYKTKEWKSFLLSFKQSKGIKIHDSLYLDLVKIAIQDQAFYKDIDFYTKKKGFKSKEVANLWHIKDSLTNENLKIIEKYLSNKINVLSNQVSGELFANKCFLVIQHSPLKKQEFYLPIIKELYLKKETTGENYAMLYDRISIEKQKGKQYFGTQVNPITNKPYPIIDEANVSMRRTSLGMIPLKEYLAIFKIKYVPY
jgi:outer membrane protein OmpA-like peptidoglycan-associated protein